MDSGSLDEKLRGFARHLLKEAQGDAVRALGLLVLVLQEDKLVPEPREAQQLLREVCKLIVPDLHGSLWSIRPMRHLAGMPTWEGAQHCILCGELLFQKGQLDGGPLPSGYVFQVGRVFTDHVCVQFTACQ